MDKKKWNNYPYRLEDIKSICNESVNLILSGVFGQSYFNDDVSQVRVRYILAEGRFGYACMGDFFFIDDCMYVISDDESFKDIHNEHIPGMVEQVSGCEYRRNEKYVGRVVFAGVRTPFKDDMGDWIYTGDIVKANNYLVSGICAFPFMQKYAEKGEPPVYGLMCDNHMHKLYGCTKLERLGTIFSFVMPGTTEIEIECVIGGKAQWGGFDEDELLCAKYTPSFEQVLWKYKALEIMGVEYGWRREPPKRK